MQRLRWVAQTIAEHGGHKYVGATESCPLLHALNTTKKQLDSLDADMAALDSELERARLCLQACRVPCRQCPSCAWPSAAAGLVGTADAVRGRIVGMQPPHALVQLAATQKDGRLP